MDLKKLVDTLIGRKHDYCEGCHRMADLNRVKVSSYAGKPSYKYLCASCERLEGLKNIKSGFCALQGTYFLKNSL